MQPMGGAATKGNEKIVKVEERGDYDAVFTVAFASEMTREDYLRQARRNKEGVVVPVFFNTGDWARSKQIAARRLARKLAALAKQVRFGPRGVYHMNMNANDQVVKKCEGCEAEYVGDQSAFCPLCPLRDNLEAAKVGIRRAEPFRILEDTARLEMQGNINRLAASGWILDDFFVGHHQDGDHGMPVFVALLRREDYDPERHRAAVDAHLRAFGKELAKRREVEIETEQFRAAHRLDQDDLDC